jgi:cation diffusion facilitator CzcD-associated flavoprotein CzcO
MAERSPLSADVAIIGAGLSGLRAARSLVDALQAGERAAAEVTALCA